MTIKKIFGFLFLICLFSSIIDWELSAEEGVPQIDLVTVSEALKGEDIRLTLQVLNQSSVESVSLFYRLDDKQIPKGATTVGYMEILFTLSDHDDYQAVIDKAFSWAPWIEYYIEGISTSSVVFSLGSSETPNRIDIIQENYYPAEQPKVLITEVYSGGGSTSDPYEFFEVYNNHFEPIDLMTYEFHYVSRIFNNYDTRNMSIEYAEKIVTWGDLTSFVLDPGEVIVFAHGGLLGEPTSVADFNAYFPESDLAEGVDFFHILNEDMTTLNATGTNGASGTNSRGWAIKDADGNLVCQTFTHLSLDGSNLPKGTSSLSNNGANKTSMLYGYLSMFLTETENEDSNNLWNEMVSSDQFIANPGWVFAGQVPDTFASMSPELDVTEDSVSINIDPDSPESVPVESLLENSFDIISNDFEGRYTSSYLVYRDDVEIDLSAQNTFIPEVGIYEIHVVLLPVVPYNFRDVISPPISLIVNNQLDAPTIDVIEEEYQVNVSDIDNVFDLSDLENMVYVIDQGDFGPQDILVTYEVTLGNLEIDVLDNKIESRAGLYRMIVKISPVEEESFAVVSSLPISFSIIKDPPILTIEAPVIYRSISMGQNSINLNWLYELNPGDFTYDEYTTSYEVTRQSQDIHLIGNTIMPTPGTYRVTIMIDPVYSGAFEPIRTTITMIATKVPPSIQLNDEFSRDVYISQSMNTIDLSQMFFIHGGAFESALYTVSLSVKKDQVNIPVTYQTIPAELGTFNVSIGISPKVSGSFPDVIMDDITLTLRPKTPELSGLNQISRNVDGKEDKNISLDSLYKINMGYYQRNDFRITYNVTKDGEPINLTDGQLPARNGTYEIGITLSSNDDAFDDVVKIVELDVFNQRQTTLSTVWISIAGLITVTVLCGGSLYFITKRRRVKEM